MASPLIAVFDNEPVFLELMGEVLADAGYRTLVSPSLDGACDTIRRERPALILLDVRMDGPEPDIGLLRALRARPETATIPVIICSADLAYLRAHGDEVRALDATTLPKPFDLSALYDTIASLIAVPVATSAGDDAQRDGTRACGSTGMVARP